MPFLESLAADGRLRAQRRPLVAAHPVLRGVERVERAPTGPHRFDVDLRFIASRVDDKGAVPPGLKPADVSVRAQRPGAPAHAAHALQRVDDTTLRAAFDPLAVLEEGSRPEELTVELRASRFVDPLSRTAILQLAGAPSAAELRIPAPPPEAADVDYLARDYDGFRQLLLDRMAGALPAWTERHAADLGVTMVEVLAYAADQLSYFQDAVATEAYLSTARRRVSVKRHARLLDAHAHEGCAARAWLRLRVTGDGVIRKGLVVTCDRPDIAGRGLDTLAGAGAAAFETLADTHVRVAHESLDLHDWGAREYALPRGATTAVLKGGGDLRAGDVVILAAAPGSAVSAPSAGRPPHPVRLVRDARPFDDPLTRESLVEISWAAEDALPATLPVAALVGGRPVTALAQVWGNVTPAEAGVWTAPAPCRLDGPEPYDAATARPLRLELPWTDLIYAAPYDDAVERTRPASSFTAPDPREATAQVRLTESADVSAVWLPMRDLLDAGRFARRFVAETEEDGTTRLRFGDNRSGRSPQSGRDLQASCRRGRMATNVGAGSLVAWASRDELGDAVIAGVSNPLAAAGGVEREPMERLRLDAPSAFRKQLRCVIPEDYVAAALEHPGVLDATAWERRAGGRGVTVVRVLPKGGGAPGAALLREVSNRLEARRLIDTRFEVRAPRFAPLDLHLQIDVAAPRRASDALRGAEGRVRRLLRAGDRRFGGVVAVGPVAAAVLAEAGVIDVHLHAFRRLGSDGEATPASGRIELDPWEVAQLDDVVTAAGRGVLKIEARVVS